MLLLSFSCKAFGTDCIKFLFLFFLIWKQPHDMIPLPLTIEKAPLESLLLQLKVEMMAVLNTISKHGRILVTEGTLI